MNIKNIVTCNDQMCKQGEKMLDKELTPSIFYLQPSLPFFVLVLALDKLETVVWYMVEAFTTQIFLSSMHNCYSYTAQIQLKTRKKQIATKV